MYWYFQQNQCLNIKKHIVHNKYRLAWGTLENCPVCPCVKTALISGDVDNDSLWFRQLCYRGHGVQFNKELIKIAMAIWQCGTPRVFIFSNSKIPKNGIFNLVLHSIICTITIHSIKQFNNYTPLQQSCRGIYWFHHVRPSVDKSYVIR